MIGTIEAAMVERIESAAKAGLLGYPLKHVDSYADEFNTKDLGTIANLLPGAWVVFQGGDLLEMQGNGVWKMRGTFAVIVGARNQRNQAAQRHGAAGDVGSYQIARDVCALLANQTLGLEIDPLEPYRIRPFPVARGKGLSVSFVASEFRSVFLITGLPDATRATLDREGEETLAEALARAATLTPLSTLTADWDTPLPCTDTLNLETAEE